MAISEKLRQRIRAFAAELGEEVGEISGSEDDSWLDLIEELSVELGDSLATSLIEGLSQPGESVPAESECPHCRKTGRYRGSRDRELLTRRGPATLQEPEYYCACCRKSFFPDDAGDRR